MNTVLRKVLPWLFGLPIFLFFVVMIGGAVVFGLHRTAREALALRHHSPRAAGDTTPGPGIWRVRVQGREAELSPLGVPALAWAFAATGVVSHAPATFCARRSALAFDADDGAGHPLHVAYGAAGPARCEFDSIGDLGLAVVDFPDRVDRPHAVPEAVIPRCPPDWRMATADYHESRLHPNDELTVIGCRLANELVPCHDGVDALVFDPPDRLLGRRLRADGHALVALFVWTGVLGLAGMGLVLALLRRTRRMRTP